MPEPIVFISHFEIRANAADALSDLATAMIPRLQKDKPRTSGFLMYRSEDGRRVSFVHVFTDADSMGVHNEGADQRTGAAYELIAPLGWEVYGRPSEAALERLRAEADAAGVALRIEPDYGGGFLRLGRRATEEG